MSYFVGGSPPYPGFLRYNAETLAFLVSSNNTGNIYSGVYSGGYWVGSANGGYSSLYLSVECNTGYVYLSDLIPGLISIYYWAVCR